MRFSDDPAALSACNVFIVTVPTPIDEYKRPDLHPLESASRTVGRRSRKGGVAIYESTVYPGATEEVCVPIIERESGLNFNQDFYAGYSPERINPGDKQHRLETIMKVTSGSTPEAADFVDALYRSIITAGTHKASSIRVAEAAKVIENTQRDVNIALINELALIFHRLGIDTQEVLEAAGTKWNFLPFRPGLVGGHCIGVDPYYLTHKAQQIGYHPDDDPGRSPHQRRHGQPCRAPRGQADDRSAISQTASRNILVLGLTFKENCPDLRNTRVVDIIAELHSYNANVRRPRSLGQRRTKRRHEYGIDLVAEPAGRLLRRRRSWPCRTASSSRLGAEGIRAFGKPGAVLFDVKRCPAPRQRGRLPVNSGPDTGVPYLLQGIP